MMWKIQQATQDDAILTARIHPAVHPGNRDEVFIILWQNFQPAYQDLGNTKLRTRNCGLRFVVCGLPDAKGLSLVEAQ